MMGMRFWTAEKFGKGYSARTITLKIRYSDFWTVTRACTVHEAVKKEDEIRHLAFPCLKRVDLAGQKVRLVGVRVSNLEKIAIVPPPV
jgi:DNA polymerase-4